MANVDVAPATSGSRPAAPADAPPLLVSLASTAPEHLPVVVDTLHKALDSPVIVVSPDIDTPESTHANVTLLPLGEPHADRSSWVLTAQDFQAAYRQASAHNASAVLLLGPEAYSLSASTIRSLVDAVTLESADLASPDYVVGPREALVNSALLYPLTRGLFGTGARFPLAVDLALSLRMAERLNVAAARPLAANDGTALVWPVSEAAVASFKVAEVPGGHRLLPAPDTEDLSSLLAIVAGSLFADIEVKAAFWQRSRAAQPQAPLTTTSASPENPSDIQSLLDGFRVAYTNLAEIWSLVLPPQSLLGLKKLSQLPATSFRMPPALWARIVYDFVLAFRLRTLNRGHLLGVLTPLYLAWVASHLLTLESGEPAGRHADQTALAFETEKPYFVSRWRWPDRFNP